MTFFVDAVQVCIIFCSYLTSAVHGKLSGGLLVKLKPGIKTQPVLGILSVLIDEEISVLEVSVREMSVRGVGEFFQVQPVEFCAAFCKFCVHVCWLCTDIMRWFPASDQR